MTPPRARPTVNPKLKDPLADRFCEAVLRLRTVEECYRFFEDVATVGEIRRLNGSLASSLWRSQGPGGGGGGRSPGTGGGPGGTNGLPGEKSNGADNVQEALN